MNKERIEELREWVTELPYVEHSWELGCQKDVMALLAAEEARLKGEDERVDRANEDYMNERLPSSEEARLGEGTEGTLTTTAVTDDRRMTLADHHAWLRNSVHGHDYDTLYCRDCEDIRALLSAPPVEKPRVTMRDIDHMAIKAQAKFGSLVLSTIAARDAMLFAAAEFGVEVSEAEASAAPATGKE